MACIHLRELYQLCQQNNIKLSSSDLIRVVCHECERAETCPAGLVDSEDKPADKTVADADQNSTTAS